MSAQFVRLDPRIWGPAILALCLSGGCVPPPNPYNQPLPRPADGNAPSWSPPATTASKPKYYVPRPADPELTAKRKKLLDMYQNAGIIRGIERPGKDPRLIVTAAFYQMEFKDKKALALLAFAHAHNLHTSVTADTLDPTEFYLWIKDSRTGKTVGSVDPLDGFVLND